MRGNNRADHGDNSADRKKGLMRERILMAAWEMIRKYGFAKTTVSDIASTAGIAKGTVYLYFQSKDEMMLALVEMTNRRINDHLVEIAESELDPRSKIRQILLYRILRIYDIVKYPHGEEVVSLMKSSISEIIGGFLDEQASLIEGCLKDGLKAGRFVKMKPTEVSRTLVSTFELMTPPYYRIKSKSDLERSAGILLDLVLDGIERTDS